MTTNKIMVKNHLFDSKHPLACISQPCSHHCWCFGVFSSAHVKKSKDVIARARARARREVRARAQIFEKARGSAERENHARFLVGRAERARPNLKM